MGESGVIHELAFEDYSMTGVGGGTPAPQNFQEWSDYPPDGPPTTEEEFVTDVIETLAGTGGTISVQDLSLITPEEWENFLAALLGFVSEAHGADQNSYYNDYSNEAPLGEYFIESWGWLPSIQQMPGYHYFDYLTQDIDPEFLQWAYAVHSSTSIFHDAGINLADIENMPITLSIGGTLITATWHSGTPPAANLGYFTVECQTGLPTGGEQPPTALDLIQLNAENLPWIPAVDQALRYLAQDPLAFQIIAQAIQHHTTIKIVTGTALHQYHLDTNVVDWNPTMGLRLTNGGLMSPAMCLLHELAHAVYNMFGSDFQYDTVEDRYIVEHLEQIVGPHLGEPIRENHQGSMEWAPTVVYHLPAPPH
jgi:hypothetical protein